LAIEIVTARFLFLPWHNSCLVSAQCMLMVAGDYFEFVWECDWGYF
jgi:hypothetical protein